MRTNPEWVSASLTQDVSRPNFSRVMRTNFGDTMAEILREHSDSLVTQFLSRLIEEARLPSNDHEEQQLAILQQQLEGLRPEEQRPVERQMEELRRKLKEQQLLLEWLKTNEKKQSSIELYTAILVSPCCFSDCNVKLAFEKSLLPDELIQEYRDSYWSAIWEENDTLIQLPKSFKTDVWSKHRKDDSEKKSIAIPSAMKKLAQDLIADLKRLQDALEKNKSDYTEVINTFSNKQKKASEVHKNQAHQMAVARIKQAHRRICKEIDSSTSSTISLFH